MAKSKKPEDYPVGYGRPPKRTRFKKGASGNPKGRPKGTKNLKTDLFEELQELVSLREGGRDQRVSKQRAMVKRVVARALEGNDRPAETIFKLMLQILDIGDEPEPERPLTQGEEAILDNLEARILRRRAGKAKSSDPNETKED